MPKLRRPSTEFSDSAPPAELLDREHKMWQSKALTKKWLDLHGLRIGQALEWGPINRHKASMYAWAKSVGIVKPPAANGYVGPDFVRMRELGLDAVGGRGATRERLEFGGAFTFDDSWMERKKR